MRFIYVQVIFWLLCSETAAANTGKYVIYFFSALRDRRFPPIQQKELPNLECTVSLLTNYEPDLHYLDWEVGKHGIIIEFTDPDYNTRRSATYLPEVAAHEGWTTLEAIESLIRKAGYNGAITESLRKQIRLTRYQSTLFTMHYSEYTNYVKTTRGAKPSLAGAKASN
ncbi:AMMECR1 domain-containing protein [Heracleum sosnowskyi]|uniref:AMMECR1 domain-containing protein n=1 Tax=Heracleum sosnowskyi TaxID=360622 RepID=A0AAD8MSW6_9APIA|nr:AMMECR1 domain-containing protein [Heracleum sosnowskyi]